VHSQRSIERLPVGIVEAQRDTLATECIFGDIVGLRIAQHLHVVFNLAQQDVGIAQQVGAGRADMPTRLAFGQCRQQAAHAQARFAAAADQLGQLHDELDLADAARAELEVIGQILARHLGIDQRLHLAQAGKRGVVKIFAIDKRPQQFLQLLAGSRSPATGRALIQA
jgi:hypothetical protein